MLAVLAAMVSLWAWARGKWERLKGWMAAKAMSLQVEGWRGTREGGREGGGGQRWMKEKAMSVEGERWKTPKE